MNIFQAPQQPNFGFGYTPVETHSTVLPMTPQRAEQQREQSAAQLREVQAKYESYQNAVKKALTNEPKMDMNRVMS